MKEKNVSDILKKGGVAVIPTDTIYGVVGQALSKKTVERVYKLKGRDPKKPCIILISSVSELKKFGIKNVKHSMLNKYWPGKVSIILPCPVKKFEYLHRGTKSLAFRLPSNKKLIALLKRTGPLVAPSANHEGLPPAKNIVEAKKYFNEKVDAYVAGGVRAGKPSKLIFISANGGIEILRK